SFTYKANNGAEDSPPATVTIAVTGAFDGPVAVNDGYSLVENTPLPAPPPGVLGSGPGGTPRTALAPGAPGNDVSGSPLTAIPLTAPLHGALNLNIIQLDGSFTYTPAPNFNGPDSFTYKANDGTTDTQNVAMVTLLVTPVNAKPSADTKAVSTLVDTAVGVTL